MIYMIDDIINKLHVYKKYKGYRYRVQLFSKNTGCITDIKTTLNLDNNTILSLYNSSLEKDGILIRNIYKEPVPTFITRIILLLEYVVLGYCMY